MESLRRPSHQLSPSRRRSKYMHEFRFSHRRCRIGPPMAQDDVGAPALGGTLTSTVRDSGGFRALNIPKVTIFPPFWDDP